jgi:hypothetical protein
LACLFWTRQLTCKIFLERISLPTCKILNLFWTHQLTCKSFLKHVSLLAKVFWNGSAYLQKFSGTGQLTYKSFLERVSLLAKAGPDLLRVLVRVDDHHPLALHCLGPTLAKIMILVSFYFLYKNVERWREKMSKNEAFNYYNTFFQCRNKCGKNCFYFFLKIGYSVII